MRHFAEIVGSAESAAATGPPSKVNEIPVYWKLMGNERGKNGHFRNYFLFLRPAYHSGYKHEGNLFYESAVKFHYSFLSELRGCFSDNSIITLESVG